MSTPQKSTSEARQLSQSAICWAEKAIEETNLTQAHFVELLAQSDEQGRFFKIITKFMPIDKGQKNTACNLKKVQRYLSYETPIPADILVAWANALPLPYRDYLKREMADIISPRSMDMHDILTTIREVNEAGAALAGGNPDEIRKEAAEAIEALQKVLGGL